VSSDEAKKLWEKASRHLKDVLHPDVFERWIAVIEPIQLTDGDLSLGVDNDFYQTWLEEHYLPLIQNAVSAVCGEPLNISFTVKKQQSAPAPEKEAQPAKKPSLRSRLGRKPKGKSSLNEKFTFDDFVVGPCNNFAHAASLAVAQAPARAYNPLFIYGGVGLGKTHLAQAIGHYVMQNSRATVAFLSSEAFLNEYITALQGRSLVQFRKKYRHIDLLLIDDIHFLAKKEQIQEEFFHTFNTLFDSHSQIVMTSDRPASEIVGLEQRLVSRFEWGLVTELEPPDLETRIAILRHKMSKTSIQLADEVVMFIAENVKSNIRRLEGALIRAISYISLTSEELTLPFLKNLLKDTIDHEKEEALSFTSIQKAVAEHYDLRVSDITGSRRPKAIAVPRQIAMYLCRHLTDSSFPEIGNAFGRSHATVFHACKTIDRKLETDEGVQEGVRVVAKALGKNL
jgi:chromosomal replication initiator protein